MTGFNFSIGFLGRLLLIGIGSGAGGIFRYLLSSGVHRLFGRAFPYGTLTVNALGSFLIGFLFILLLDRFSDFAEQFRSLLIIGFLGGLTTFSSFSLETLNLIEGGEILRAFLNIILSVTVCLCLAWLGIILGRHL